jgi:type IV secretory pathway VirB2 component (pilin)
MDGKSLAHDLNPGKDLLMASLMHAPDGLCRAPARVPLLSLVLVALGTLPALAADGGGMPWDPLLDSLVANIGGRTLKSILILAIIGAGIGFYFANEGTFIRTAFGLVIGFSIAVAAATWGPTFFGLAAAQTPTPGTVPAIRWFDWVHLGITLATWMSLLYVLVWRLDDVRWWFRTWPRKECRDREEKGAGRPDVEVPTRHPARHRSEG